MKNNILHTSLVLFACVFCSSAFGQIDYTIGSGLDTNTPQVLDERFLENMYTAYRSYYFYKGDQIVVKFDLTEGKAIAKYRFFKLDPKTDNRIDLEYLTKQKIIDNRYTIVEDGVYGIDFETAVFKNFKGNLKVSRICQSEEEYLKPLTYLKNEKFNYYPDLSTHIVGYEYKPVTLEELKQETIRLHRLLGIDHEALDVPLGEIDNFKGKYDQTDTNIISNATNKIFGTIYADPYDTDFYFRANKGDSIIIKCTTLDGKELQKFTLYNNYTHRTLGNLISKANATNFSYGFVAGNDYIYTLNFTNVNNKNTPVRITIYRVINSSHPDPVLRPISFTYIEKVVTSENGLLSARHTHNIPILD